MRLSEVRATGNGVDLSVEEDLLRLSYLLSVMSLDRMSFDVGVLPYT
jgi:hypothetical protein